MVNLRQLLKRIKKLILSVAILIKVSMGFDAHLLGRADAWVVMRERIDN